MRPLILLSNDDGIDSPLLGGVADAIDFADVLVIAPERPRSAMSHTITLHKPLRLIEVAPRRFCASGTPVDCVYLGLLKLADRQPALVISGINDGFNLGTDVFYSGTVGAAVEGGLRGVSALALSAQPRSREAWPEAIRFAVALARTVIETDQPPGVLNVNMPAGFGGSYRWTTLGRRVYEDDVQLRVDPRGNTYYWIGGGEASLEQRAGTDCQAIADGLASITPLSLDRTDHTRVVGPPLAIAGYELR